MPRGKVLDWLLEADQPSIRYLALTQLLSRKESDADVRDAKASIPEVGWASEILARRDPAGWWARDRGWLDLSVGEGRTGSQRDARCVGGIGSLRRLPSVKVDPCDEGLRRTERGILPRARTPRPGGTVRAVVPLPLAHPLLLRPPGWPRLSDRARLWEGPSARVRARPPSQEAAARREMDPRRGATGPAPGGRTVVRGASE